MSDARPAQKRHAGGRPRKPPEERRTLFLRVRLTEREYDMVCLAALRRNITMRALILEAVSVASKLLPASSGPIIGAKVWP